MDVVWRCQTLDELNSRDLLQMLILRSRVFVVEQQCIYLDPDALDGLPETRHLSLWQEGTLLACLRLLPPGASYPEPSLGRVVVAPEARGQGWSRPLLQQALRAIAQYWPDWPVVISAQSYLLGLYQSLGFLPEGEPYLEDGIPHQQMRYVPSAEKESP